MPESAPSIDDTRRGSGERILVLGAGGFIGRRIVAALASSGWAVPVAVRHRSALQVDPKVETVVLDATQPEALRAALSGVGGVVNCIAGNDRAIVASARALFEAGAALSPPPRVVHLSTMMVYGTATGIVAESATLKGDWDGYSAAKTEVERLARAYPAVVCLRPGIVYGPHSPIWCGSIGRWLMARRLGDLGGAGRGICNLVHVDDVARAVCLALRQPGIEGEAFNLSLSDAPTWNEYFRQFGAALGVTVRSIPPWRLFLEQHLYAPPLKVAGRLSTVLHLGWRPPEAIRPWLPRLCRHELRLDVRKAERVLGLRWVTLEEGLRESAQWALEEARAA